MIEAKKNNIFQRLFAIYTNHLLRKTFNGIYIKGEENFLNRNKNIPTVVFLNHSSWWDALIPFYLSYSVWNADGYAFMDIKQLQKYKFFRRIGVFSVDRESGRESMKSIGYALELLKNKDTVLWIFPQGELLHWNVRPVAFEHGLSYMLSKSGKVNLIPAALNYEFLMEQRPEIFISVSEPVVTDNEIPRRKMSEHLGGIMEKMLDEQKSLIVSGNTGSYRTLMKGKKSKNKILDRVNDDID
jgi:1-acyl-sn-glycerol-3-phosphate acyltransferase